MAIELYEPIRLLTNQDLDAKKGPWNSTTEALAGIPSYQRYPGLNIKILEAGEAIDYVFRTDADNPILVKRSLASVASGIQSFVDLASFPATGESNVLYIALDTAQGYVWDGVAYQASSRNVEQYADLASFPATGSGNVVYIAQDTGFTYFWSGEQYNETSASPVSAAGSSGASLYSHVAIVDATNGDDTSGAIDDRSKPFLTHEAARAAFNAEYPGELVLMYTKAGNYSIDIADAPYFTAGSTIISLQKNIHHYLEDGVICTVLDKGTCLSDKFTPAEYRGPYTVMGNAEFRVNTVSSGSDEDAVNLYYGGSEFKKIEAKRVDSIQVWNDARSGSKFVLNNCEVWFGNFANWYNNSYEFNDCVFYDFKLLSVPGFGSTEFGVITFNRCKFKMSTPDVPLTAANYTDSVLGTGSTPGNATSCIDIWNSTSGGWHVAAEYKIYFNNCEIDLEHDYAVAVKHRTPSNVYHAYNETAFPALPRINASQGVWFNNCSINDLTPNKTGKGFSVAYNTSAIDRVNSGYTFTITNQKDCLRIYASNVIGNVDDVTTFDGTYALLTNKYRSYRLYTNKISTGSGLEIPNKEDTTNAPLTTSVDGDSTGIALTLKPTGLINVLVNGISELVGDGVKTTACYFSSDGGTTAKLYEELDAGDILYWNGSIAGYELLVDFDIKIQYLK